MLRLIEIDKQLPVSRPVDLTAEYMPGMIAQLYRQSGRVVAGVSDGTIPYGIIDDIKTRTENSSASGYVTIWASRGLVFETDQFERRHYYNKGQSLFVENTGRLSPEPDDIENPRVAEVVIPPTAEKNTLTFKWL